MWIANLLKCLCILLLLVATASRNTAISVPQILQIPLPKNLPETQEHHITLWILLKCFLGHTKQCHISPKAVNICSLFCGQAHHCHHWVSRHTKKTVDASFQNQFQIFLNTPVWCTITTARQDCSPSRSNAGFISPPPQLQKEKRIVRKKVIVQLFLWKPPGGARDDWRAPSAHIAEHWWMDPAGCQAVPLSPCTDPSRRSREKELHNSAIFRKEKSVLVTLRASSNKAPVRARHHTYGKHLCCDISFHMEKNKEVHKEQQNPLA